DALEQLSLAPAVLASGRPWPGELERLRLGNQAGALKSQACEDYRAALAELTEMAARTAAVSARAAFDGLLREYGARYTALKRGRSALDFSDLELLARELLRRPELGSRYRERFTRVMVDEMQDTNGVQLELIELVAGPDLFMVGDAQQSIYGFRHADVELFAARGARLERSGARATLATNFRSRAEILAALNGAFARALRESFRPLVAGREDAPASGPLVELIIADRDGSVPDADPLIEQLAAPWRVAEARALAARVRELIAAGEASAGEVVVLLRATTDMSVYEQALEAAGVPTYVIGGRGYWSHPQVLELVAYLRVLANPLDSEALYGVLSSPLCGLSLDGLVLEAAGARDELGTEDRRRLDEFEAWLAGERRAASWLGAEQLLDRALLRRGYELQIAALPDARRRLANVRKLMRLARKWQSEHGSDLRGFVDLLQSRSEGGDGAAARESEAPVEGEALDAVRLMTIHRSKGLEFPVVCVADLGRQLLPRGGALVKVGRDGSSLGLRLRRPGEGRRVSVLAYDALKAEEREREAEEERRLFYVAMTRAQERLIVSGAARLERWEEANRYAPIGWVGAAFVPDIADRAAAAGEPVAADRAASAGVLTGSADAVAPAPFVTDEGVLVHFVSAAPVAPVAPPAPVAPVAEPAADDAGSVLPPQAAKRFPDAVQALVPSVASPVPSSLSYTALALYEQCGYRYYVQRVLGLPDMPIPEPIGAGQGRGEPALTDVPTRPGLRGAERGTLIHQLLAGIDPRAPSLPEPESRQGPEPESRQGPEPESRQGLVPASQQGLVPEDVRELLAGLFASTTFKGLAGPRDLRREQRFAFPVGETLITGVFDVIAQDRDGRMLVLDYKSDRLAGVAPEAIVSERYTVQRLIYGLAALKLGAPEVEVVHLFLEAPEEPVSAQFTATDMPALESELAERVAGLLAGDFPVTDVPGRRVCDGCPAQGGLCSYPLELTTC
ncbi:MAG: UvrD-helicase domain-containing protein, partial [Acidobacteriota bacterium]|nr:UvrD-helicase domain-containing protein [Acidobacteriota bacterium]